MKVLVIYSGGMDSTVLLTQAVKDYDEVEALNFSYGSKHNYYERIAAINIASLLDIKLTLIDLDFIGELFKSDLLKSGGDIPEGHYEAESMKSTVVPFRNGIMLAIAAGYAESIEAREIMLASHVGDHHIYPDCRADFTMAMSLAIILGTDTKVDLAAPFSTLTKTDVVALGHEIGAPLHLSYSCYKGDIKHCGKCGTCVERIEAFHDSGFIDPVVYETPIDWKDCVPYTIIPKKG